MTIKVSSCGVHARLAASSADKPGPVLQMPLPIADKAAYGDALLVPASGPGVLCSSHYLAVLSPILATACQLAELGASRFELMRLPVPRTSEVEAVLLVSAAYSRDLPGLLDTLPPARLQSSSTEPAVPASVRSAGCECTCVHATRPASSLQLACLISCS